MADRADATGGAGGNQLIGAGLAPAGGPDPLHGALTQDHGQSSAMFDKLAASQKTMAEVRRKLDALVKMGDTVEPEDVIKAAGDLTGFGLEPAMLAQLLSSMPQGGGQALAAWIRDQDMQVAQHEQMINQAHLAAAHKMAVDAMHLLMHDHMQQKRQLGGLGQPSAGGQPAAPAASATPSEASSPSLGASPTTPAPNQLM